jgi:exosortase A-associated hydrolase 2
MTGLNLAQKAKTMPRAFYLPSPAGELATFYFQAEEGIPRRHDVLYIHPFGLELPESRTVMSSLWRYLAGAGIGVFAIDLPGCGDSEGDFSDATWDRWLIALATAWKCLLECSSGPVSVCGMRLGASLALDLVNQVHHDVDRVVLMSPVLNGEQMMTQCLRLRVAFSGLRDVPEKRETTEHLRNMIAAGEFLEVGGYILNPKMVAHVDQISLGAWQPPRPDLKIDVIDVGPGPFSAPMNAIAESWRNTGPDVTTHKLSVKPFWTHARGAAAEYIPLAETLRSILLRDHEPR